MTEAAAVTPGQAAYEATLPIIHENLRRKPWRWDQLDQKLRDSWDAAAQAAIGAAGAPEVWRGRCVAHAAEEHVQVRTWGNWMCALALRGLDDGWATLERERDEARAGRDKALAANERWAAALGDVQQRHTEVKAERDATREELADAKALLRYWPLCPDGCGCRLGVTGPDGENDADARDCACDGPCCIECRENGYPDAPSYRDIAVKHVMDDLTEASAIIEALREDHGRTDRYRQALEAARRALSSIALGTARDPSVAADNAAVEIGRALDDQHG